MTVWLTDQMQAAASNPALQAKAENILTLFMGAAAYGQNPAVFSKFATLGVILAIIEEKCLPAGLKEIDLAWFGSVQWTLQSVTDYAWWKTLPVAAVLEQVALKVCGPVMTPVNGFRAGVVAGRIAFRGEDLAARRRK